MWAKTGDLLPAALSLAGGSHILIATGFYVLSAGTIETDGPPGSIMLAKALTGLGKKVTILTDDLGEAIIRPGLDVADCTAELLVFSRCSVIDYDGIITPDTTHCVALERPGLAADGLHHNLEGHVISDHIARLDDVYLRCASRGIVTIGIGDGGNELGMGNVSDAVNKYIAPREAYSCAIPSDLCICSGVSNWGGYALAALLSVLGRINLLPIFETFCLLLETIVRAGAVDGVTGRQEATVDDLPRIWEDGIFSLMYHVAAIRCEGRLNG